MNEIASFTGTFRERQLTSILICDTDSSNVHFKKDEDSLMTHIESVCDHQIKFENETTLSRHKQSLPVLPVSPGQQYLNAKQWTRPFLAPSVGRVQALCRRIDEAFTVHRGKQQMKIQEDPWENYLYHDSKFVLPLLCHTRALSVEQQVIVSMFILQTV